MIIWSNNKSLKMRQVPEVRKRIYNRVQSAFRNERVWRHFCKAVDASERVWSKLASSCKGCIALHTHLWFSADVWPWAFSCCVSSKTNEVSNSVKYIQKLFFGGGIYCCVLYLILMTGRNSWMQIVTDKSNKIISQKREDSALFCS